MQIICKKFTPPKNKNSKPPYPNSESISLSLAINDDCFAIDDNPKWLLGFFLFVQMRQNQVVEHYFT